MLRDLDTSKFKAVYIVTGYTDLRNGIDDAFPVLWQTS